MQHFCFLSSEVVWLSLMFLWCSGPLNPGKKPSWLLPLSHPHDPNMLPSPRSTSRCIQEYKEGCSCLSGNHTWEKGCGLILRHSETNSECSPRPFSIHHGLGCGTSFWRRATKPAAAWGPLLLSPSSVVTFPVSTEGQMAEHLQSFEGFLPIRVQCSS